MTRAACGCVAAVKEVWVEEFARLHRIDLGKEKFVDWEDETKEAFVRFIRKKLSRGQLTHLCSLHR